MAAQEDALTDSSRHVVARRVIVDIVEREIGEVWESYPEIGEFDWLAIQELALKLVRELGPSQGAFEAAYARLEGRAFAEGSYPELHDAPR